MTHREQALVEALLEDRLVPPLAHIIMLGLIAILALPAVPVPFVLTLLERLDAETNRITLLRELQASLTEVKVLRGILPICASCKRIRSDAGGWEAVESYVRDHTNAEFTHGLCPDCAARDWDLVPS